MNPYVSFFPKDEDQPVSEMGGHRKDIPILRLDESGRCNLQFDKAQPQAAMQYLNKLSEAAQSLSQEIAQGEYSKRLKELEKGETGGVVDLAGALRASVDRAKAARS